MTPALHHPQPIATTEITVSRAATDGASAAERAPTARPGPRGAYGAISGPKPSMPAAKVADALGVFRDRALHVDSTGAAGLARLSASARAASGALEALEPGGAHSPLLSSALADARTAVRDAQSRVAALIDDPSTSPSLKGAGLKLRAELTRLADHLGSTPTPDIGRPASTLPKFDVQKYWDADSTPGPLAALSRAVGSVAPSSGGRTPQIEAAIVMASLMHDVSYYYGGWSADKDRADQLFGAQIPYFAQKLDPAAGRAAKIAAAVDVAAVQVGGGVPFKESYSWSYGFEPSQRGYASLDPGELEKIQDIARTTFRDVVGQIADGRFQLSDVLTAKLAKASPEYQAQLKANVVELCKALERDFASGRGAQVPGF